VQIVHVQHVHVATYPNGSILESNVLCFQLGKGFMVLSSVVEKKGSARMEDV
jgi:hypothetical protein